MIRADAPISVTPKKLIPRPVPQARNVKARHGNAGLAITRRSESLQGRHLYVNPSQRNLPRTWILCGWRSTPRNEYRGSFSVFSAISAVKSFRSVSQELLTAEYAESALSTPRKRKAKCTTALDQGIRCDSRQRLYNSVEEHLPCGQEKSPSAGRRTSCPRLAL